MSTTPCSQFEVPKSTSGKIQISQIGISKISISKFRTSKVSVSITQCHAQGICGMSGAAAAAQAAAGNSEQCSYVFVGRDWGHREVLIPFLLLSGWWDFGREWLSLTSRTSHHFSCRMGTRQFAEKSARQKSAMHGSRRGHGVSDFTLIYDCNMFSQEDIQCLDREKPAVNIGTNIKIIKTTWLETKYPRWIHKPNTDAET